MSRPLPAEVRAWPRPDIERWLELAGYQLDAGATPEEADGRATEEMRRVRGAR